METVVIYMSPPVQQKVSMLSSNLESTRKNLEELNVFFQTVIIDPVVLVEEVPTFESVDVDAETNLIFKIQNEEVYKVELPESLKTNVKSLADQRNLLIRTESNLQSQLESIVQLLINKDGTVSFSTHKFNLQPDGQGSVQLVAEPIETSAVVE